MAYDTNGIFNLPSPQFPAIPGTVITSTDYNAILTSIADALSLALIRDGRAHMTGTLNMGSNKITNLANGVAPKDAVNVETCLALLASSLPNYADIPYQVDAYRLNFNSKVSGVTPSTAKVLLPMQLSSSTYGDHALRVQSVVAPAFVTAPAVYTPTIWGTSEFTMKNSGEGRVNNLNLVLDVQSAIRSDNTNLFMYQKASAVTQVSSLEYGGTVGIWLVTDTRGTATRGIGAEFVMVGDKLEYDVEPSSSLATVPDYYATQGKASFGLRVSNLEAATSEGQVTPPCIFPRGIDVWGAGNKGFDTGIAINGWRSRGLYIGNTLDSTVQGGNGWGIQLERNVVNLLVTGTKVGAPGEAYNLSLQQQYSPSKNAQYFTLRKDSANTWFSMYNDLTVTMSTNSNGAGLTLYPSGLIAATRVGAGVANASFAIPSGGRYYLDGGSNTYFTHEGSSVRLYKNGVSVASW